MTIKDLLNEYSEAISEKIQKELTPIYNPNDESLEKYETKIKSLLRKPFPVQGEIIKGLSKAMYETKREKLFVCGQMGCGKTILALSTIFMSPKPLRTLIVCPGHLVEKWIREVKITLPNVTTIDLAVKHAISLLQRLRGSKEKPENHELWIISKERAKLGSGWASAFVKRKKLLEDKNNDKKYIISYPSCPDCGSRVSYKGKNLSELELSKRKHICNKCLSPLWQATPKPRRFPPAEYIRTHLKNKFDMVVLDEIHDYKEGNSLQGFAMGSLAVSAKKFLGLTGTLNGGYADNLFFLLYRLNPAELKDFTYKGSEKWQETYGVLEKIQKVEEKDFTHGKHKSKGVIIKKKPGISPEVIGRYFLDKSCFIKLEDVIDGLPPYDEHVVSLDMQEEQKTMYKLLESQLREMVKKYRMRAAGAMLQSLLCYPDSCTSFPEFIQIQNDIATAPKLHIDILPKEQELIRITKQEKAQGRKTLVYITFTGTRDIRSRIQSVLEAENLKVGILPETIEPKKREAWIEKNAHNIDVLITNPELVKVGLDLIQFPTIVFFEVGYNIFTLRQAAKRSWRIGQKEPVRVFYLCYKASLQETALSLVANKIEVALLTEGEIPEGLADYTDEGDSILTELVKSLTEEKRYINAETLWANMRKKEIESSLSITGKEIIFTEKTIKTVSIKKTITESTVAENTVITVSIIEGKGKKTSTLSVKYGELDEALKGKIAQFSLF